MRGVLSLWLCQCKVAVCECKGCVHMRKWIKIWAAHTGGIGLGSAGLLEADQEGHL
jgi:hypothetical protein